MKTITCVLAILAAASTMAVAKDFKQEKKAMVPTVAAAQMSDAEMDKVTAGAAGGATYDLGVRSPHGNLVPDSAWHNQARFTCQYCY